MEDQTIIELFFARSETAVAALDEKYGTVCKRIADNILGDPQDAEECINDTYLGVWNSIPPQRPEVLLAYLCRIVRNQAIMRCHVNSAKKRCSAYDAALDELEDCLAGSGSAEEESAAGELAQALERFLAAQKQLDRVLFVRRYWYGDTIGVLAERCGMSRNGVSVRLRRTREKLKEYLRKEGYTV